MSLTIYMNEPVPEEVKLIVKNDSYFKIYTNLDESEECARILSIIDKAEYAGKESFRGRDESKKELYKGWLSTGSKTALNVLMHKDVCFDMVECGNNAKNVILGLTDGMIKFNGAVLFDDNIKDKLDIIIDGIKVTTPEELSMYIKENR